MESELHRSGVAVLVRHINKAIKGGPVGIAQGLCNMDTHWPTGSPDYAILHQATSADVGSDGTGGRPQISVEGKIPDVIIYDEAGRVCAVAEVVVTSAPSKEKLSRFEKANIPVIVKAFSTWRDLALFAATDKEIYNCYDPDGSLHGRLYPSALDRSAFSWFATYTESHRLRNGATAHSTDPDTFVGQIIGALRYCSPQHRIALREVLDRLDSDESLMRLKGP